MANHVRHPRGGRQTHATAARWALRCFSLVEYARGRVDRVWPVLLVLCIGGCSAPGPAVSFSTIANASPAAIETGQRIAADPEAFLREARTRCEALPAYEVDFYKQERLGLFVKKLQPEEHMRVKFRARPFSVKMTMLNEDHEFAETLYVEGENDNKLRCRRRKGLLGGRPPIQDFPPDFAVQFGRSINPITDFGVARLMQRVLSTLEEARAAGAGPEVVYRGIAELEYDALPVHHVSLQYPQAAPIPSLKVDLLFHVDTLLPAASYVRPGGERLQGRYVYTRFDLHPEFGDGAFELSEGGEARTR